jgi:hypothetical protein
VAVDAGWTGGGAVAGGPVSDGTTCGTGPACGLSAGGWAGPVQAAVSMAAQATPAKAMPRPGPLSHWIICAAFWPGEHVPHATTRH